MSTLLQDLRFGLRVLARRPGFTAVAVLVLAIGIGANTAVFSIVNALVLRPLPADQVPGTLVGLYSRDRVQPDSYRSFSYPNYLDIREENRVFSSLLAQGLALVGIAEGDSTRRAMAMAVSSNFFETLGEHLAVGRAFTPEEERPGSEPMVAVVSDTFWRGRGSDPGLLGETIRVNGRDYTVVGITSRGFTGTSLGLSPEVYVPLGAYELIVNDLFREGSTGAARRSREPRAHPGGPPAARVDRRGGDLTARRPGPGPGGGVPGGQRGPGPDGPPDAPDGHQHQPRGRRRPGRNARPAPGHVRDRSVGRLPQPREHDAGPRERPAEGDRSAAGPGGRPGPDRPPAPGGRADALPRRRCRRPAHRPRGHPPAGRVALRSAELHGGPGSGPRPPGPRRHPRLRGGQHLDVRALAGLAPGPDGHRPGAQAAGRRVGPGAPPLALPARRAGGGAGRPLPGPGHRRRLAGPQRDRRGSRQPRIRVPQRPRGQRRTPASPATTRRGGASCTTAFSRTCARFPGCARPVSPRSSRTARCRTARRSGARGRVETRGRPAGSPTSSAATTSPPWAFRCCGAGSSRGARRCRTRAAGWRSSTSPWRRRCFPARTPSGSRSSS